MKTIVKDKTLAVKYIYDAKQKLVYVSEELQNLSGKCTVDSKTIKQEIDLIIAFLRGAKRNI